jgi:hypothetical protein
VHPSERVDKKDKEEKQETNGERKRETYLNKHCLLETERPTTNIKHIP